MSNNLIEKKISSKKLLEGVIFDVERQTVILPNGNEAIRDVVVNPNAAAIVAIDDEQNIVMVRQYRTSANRIMLEIPAGKLDAGEQPIVCAGRELREETGYTAKDIKFLFSPMVSPGFSTEQIHIFMATDLTLGKTDPDEDEFVDTVKIPLTQVIEKVMNGEIQDGKTISGVLAAARILKV